MYALEHPALFQQFLEYLPLTVAMIDTQMHYLAVSRHWSDIYGVANQSLIGQKIKAEILEDLSLEFAVNSSDTRTRYPWYQESGEIGGWILIADQRQKAENPETAWQQITQAQEDLKTQLRESQQHYKTLAQLSPVGIYRADAQGQCLYVTQRWCQISGLTLAESLGFGWSQALHPEDRDWVIPHRSAALKENQVWSAEFRVITPEGKIRWVLVQEVPDIDESGDIMGYVGGIIDITERKQTEEKLTFLRTAVDSASDAIGMADATGHHIYQNRAFSELYEYETVEAFNESGGILAAYVDPAVGMEVLNSIIQGQSWTGEVEHRTRTGRVFPVSLKADIIRDQQGNMIGLLGRITDISERKALEKKLAQQQSLLESLIHNSPVGIGILDDQFCYLQINETLAQINGLPAPDHIGQSIRQMIPDLVSHVEPILQQVLVTDTPLINLETKGYTAQQPGVERHWLTSYIPLHLDYSQQETPVAVGLFVLEITEQKRLETEQRATAQRLSLLVQQTPLAVIEWNTNFQVTAWNPAAERIFGYAATEAMGRDGFALMVPESAREIVSKGLNELLAQRGGYHRINENFTKDGRIIICEWYNTPLVDDQGHLVGIASLALDITERVEAEAALEKSQELYRTLVENFPNGDVCLFDRDNRYILAGGTELAARGFKDDIVEGKTIWDVFPHPFCQQLLPAYEAALNGISKVVEITYGEQIYNTHTLPVKNEGEEVSACMVMTQNVTERKRTELALQQSWSQIGNLAQRAELLNELTQQIRQSLDLDVILETTVREICDQFQIDRCQFVWYRMQQDPPIWEIVKEARNADLPSLIGAYPISFEDPFIEDLVHNHILRVDDTITNAPQAQEILLAMGYTSLLSVPIQIESEDLGIIVCANCDGSRPWTNSEVELLESVAVQVEIAIKQAELYEKMRRTADLAQGQAQQQELINLLGTQIRQSLDLSEILETTVQRIWEVLPLERCHFAWYRPQTIPPQWEVVQEARIPGLTSHLGSYPAKDFQFILDQILDQLDSEHIAIDDMTNPFEPVLLTINEIPHLNLPIYTRSGDLGVIACIPQNHPYAWTDREVDLLKAVAGQLAIAIEQASLYQKTTEAAAIAEAKSIELATTLEELKQTQTQLIQNEKMSSLGQMVAGVAHEINNPVGFIYGNIDHAQTYATDLLKVVNLYLETYQDPSEELQNLIEDVDLEFILEDLPKVLNSMKVGAERISEIVRSLKNFSRLDEAKMKAVDIHTGIDSTLMILNNRLKAKPNYSAIEILKEYGELPLVECYAGQLNQVFMNLISNAIDALEPLRFQENYETKIIIRTEKMDSEWVSIAICDNGAGMSAAVREKIFDPFFTTKPVGKGTGLGLSISYQIIVEKHKGKLWCESTLNQGTTFTILIPVSHPDY